MTYQFLSSTANVLPLLAIAAALLLRRRMRRTAQLCVKHTRLPRPNRHRLQLWFVLVPLRLIAGRRPLLAQLQRADTAYTAALEAKLGMAVSPFDEALAAHGLPTSAENAAYNATRTTVNEERELAAFSVPPAQLGERVHLEPDDILGALRARRYQAWAQAKAIADATAVEPRLLTAEERGQWDLLNEEMHHLDQRIRTVIETQERAKAATVTVHACLSSCTNPTHVVNIRAIGDREDRWIAATPEHEAMMNQRIEGRHQ